MEYETLKFEEEGRVAIIMLLRLIQKAHKIVRLSAELSECCQRFSRNDEARVLVVKSDRQEVFSIVNGLTKVEEEMKESFSITEPIAALEKPVLVGIPGDAVGPGLELALACDLRIASESARFGLTHLKAGIIPWDGGTQRLPRLIGKAKAMEMMLTGAIINAQEAYRIGLVNKIVDADRLDEIVMEMAHEMASKAPIAGKYAKELINKGMDLRLDQALRLEADLYLLLHTTRDRSEGIRAFQAKRKPRFEGK
jgi:enoyl-CoA hydratase/carnithine racemase